MNFYDLNKIWRGLFFLLQLVFLVDVWEVYVLIQLFELVFYLDLKVSLECICEDVGKF